MRPRSRHFRYTGFTLTELLVVIVIIVTVAALSMVGIRRMRDMADRTSAMRSLSQLQLANASYATDNGGKYVPKQINDSKGNREQWWFAIPEFLINFRGELPDVNGKPSVAVPLEMLDPKVVRTKRAFYNSMPGSFGMNQTGIQDSGKTPNAAFSHSVGTVEDPSRSMAFATATDLGVQYRSRLTWFTKEPDKREGKTVTGDLAYRHGDKIIAVYFDGHVEQLSKADILAIDKNGGAANVFWDP
jgi:prepilin-type N-terminal cleavage/methylation domain-containing protein/prepilin-type processing-associated H-X9-DG protein